MALTILKGSGAILLVVDNGGTTREMTTAWLSGHPAPNNEVVDVSAIVDSGRRNNPGLQNADIRLQFLYDDAATTGSWVVFSNLLTSNTTARNIVWNPGGTASGDPKVTLPVRVMGITPGGAVGDKLILDVNMVIDGTWTIGTN